MMDRLEHELAASFSEVGVDLQALELARPCATLCETYRMSAEDLAAAWEAYALSGGGSKQMSLPALEDFKAKALHKTTRNAHLSKQQFARKGANAKALTKDTLHLLGAGGDGKKRAREGRDAEGRTSTPDSFGTPAPASAARDGAAKSPLHTGPSPQYLQRPDVGKVEACLNDALGLGPPHATDDSDGVVTVDAEAWHALAPLGRHMWERLDEKAAHIDRRTHAIGRAICEHAGLDEPGSVLRATIDDISAVGRIVCDAEGKLNAQSVYLETTRGSSSAVRIRLDLAEVPSYALFPGQVVVVRGTNARGNALAVRHIFTTVPRAPPPPMPEPAVRALGGLRVMVAAGPYTTDDSLTYEPLRDLLAEAEQRGAHALILSGPFVDEAHPAIREPATLGVTYEHIFKEKVVDTLHAWLAKLRESGRCAPTVVMCPATQDVHAHPTFPQAPLELGGSDGERDASVFAVRNPATFAIGGVVFGVCSEDAVKALSGDELAKHSGPPSTREDRMARLCRHVLDQRLFLPGHPTPKDLAVDTKLALEHATLPVTPHVLVLPSDLNKFAKEARGTICVNPGRLVKRMNGGTYAVLHVHPPAEEAAAAPAAAAPEPAPPAAAPADADALAAKADHGTVATAAIGPQPNTISKDTCVHIVRI